MSQTTPGNASDEKDIVDIAIAYTWAIDTKSFNDLRNIFSADATAMLHGVACADVDAIVARIEGAVGRLDATQHLCGNHQVVVTGDTATHRCHLHGQHVKKGTDGGDNFVIGGFYDDVFVRTSSGWRIKHRIMQGTWTSGNVNVVKK